jgi:hypothetical protein
MGTKQKKVSIPQDEIELAKKQAQRDGFGENVTGWVRWIIRGKCTPEKKKTVKVQT